MARRCQDAGQANSLWLLDPLARVSPLRQIGQVGDGVRAAGDAGRVGVIARSILL